MKKIIIDTDILIDYVNGYAPWLTVLLKAQQEKTLLILPTIVMAEYFTSTEFEKQEKIAIADDTFALFHKQVLSEEIAKILGKLLRRKTYPASADLADLIIASTCISLNGELATRNKKDFAKIPDLRFFTPPAHH